MSPDLESDVPVHEFEALLEEEDGRVMVVVPFAVADVFGSSGAVPVLATLDGYPHRGSLDPIGDGYHALLVPKQVRRTVGKTLGDSLLVTVRRDDAPPRQLTPPDDLAAALAGNSTAAAYYEKLGYEQQRDYVRWLAGAKRAEVRTQRLAETVKRLAQGRRRPQAK